MLALLAAAACLLSLAAIPCAAVGGPGSITSEAYVVMNADTGQILIGKNADEELSPASVTKIMTIGLACEKAQGDWSTVLTVSHDDVHSLYGTDSSHIALQEGEQVKLEDLLYGAMLSSANDACNVLAEYFGGSIDGGVAAMNDKAAALGLAHTHFANPHGISEDGHYTSAADLAAILRWALAQPGFSTLFCRSDMWPMAPTNLQTSAREFWLQDYMRMPGSRHYVAEITGSKIGYTNIARYTYACLAEKDGVRLICTVLKSESKVEKYADVASLLSWCFSNFRPVNAAAPADVTVSVSGGGGAVGTLTVPAPDVSVLLENSLDESAVSWDTGAASYVLGGAVPSVQCRIAGGGVQEDAVLEVPLTLTGLDKLLDSCADTQLPAAAQATASAARGRLSIGLACLAAAACVGVLWLRARNAGTQKGRKRLHNTGK
jgi:D-alanyl-D-alanine carboxypeptidase (penicillin-binding protein 5/6)